MEFIDLNIEEAHRSDGYIYMNSTDEEDQEYDNTLFEKMYIFAVFFLLFAGIFANSVLIVAIRRSPRLKAPIFQLLFALAFADLILVITYSLPSIGSYLNDEHWIYGTKGCTVLSFLRFLPAHVTSCLIVICCWERFYAVCRPHSHSALLWITPRRMSGIIAITWLLNAGVLAPLIVMTKPVTLYYKDGSFADSCDLTMPNYVKKLYFTITGMLFYGITAVISTAFLSCTICKITRVDLENYFIKDDFKTHILRCIAVITGTAILAWIPYYYAYFYRLHSSDGAAASSSIVTLGTMLVLISGVVKPVLYVSVSSQFRKSVIRALRCCGKEDFQIEQTHGYRMKDFKLNDRRLLTEIEPVLQTA